VLITATTSVRPGLRRIAAARPVLALAAALAAAGGARADEVSAALAKYDKPVAAAIDRALAYLAGHQRTDGAICTAPSSATAVTSLSVMAFLAKGHTPGTGPYGQTIDRAIDYVLATQQSNGLLLGQRQTRGPMYSHSIAALMLSEVSGMVGPSRQRKVDAALGRALRLILAAQQVRKSATHRGGWRYNHTSTDSDISCSGWAVMSLRSARNNGAAVPAESVNQAVEFILRCRGRDGGFCYQPGGQTGLARTGTALLCLELCGRHAGKESVAAGEYVLDSIGAARSDQGKVKAQQDKAAQRYAQVVAAAKKRVDDAETRRLPAATITQLKRRHEQMARQQGEMTRRRAAMVVQRSRVRFGGSHFYYGLYYCSQGMFQLGGRYWEQFGAFLYEMMLKFQEPDGSWPRRSVGTCYSTAMGVLAMSVSYRQLPIYQR
jgi:hypothetical protein